MASHVRDRKSSSKSALPTAVRRSRSERNARAARPEMVEFCVTFCYFLITTILLCYFISKKHLQEYDREGSFVNCEGGREENPRMLEIFGGQYTVHQN